MCGVVEYVTFFAKIDQIVRNEFLRYGKNKKQKHKNNLIYFKPTWYVSESALALSM